MVDELATLTTTTALVVRAAALEAAKRPEDKRMGLIVALVRGPDRISPKFLARARAALASEAKPEEPRPQRAGEAPPDESIDVADRRLIDSTPPDVVAEHVRLAIEGQAEEFLRVAWQRKGLDSRTLRATVAHRIREARQAPPANPQPDGGPR